MASALMGFSTDESAHPSDPHDLTRCIELLVAVPDAAAHMQKISAISPTWSRLVDNWGELMEMLRLEVDKPFADNTYKRMREIIHDDLIFTPDGSNKIRVTRREQT